MTKKYKPLIFIAIFLLVIVIGIIFFIFLIKDEEKARKAEEDRIKRDAEIEAAWVMLETPYISQTQLGVFNGCEAASLLMGLQYKGYLKDITFYSFVDNMPKSEDNPHEGFVRDIYDKEPKDLPHWIAPDALAKYGRASSGNDGVTDITGFSIDQLKKEIDNNNPVVFYITGGKLDDPRDWIEGIPLNVHIVLLIGYNPITKQIVVNDPSTKSSDGKMYYDEERVNEIYNQVGRKAVVIR